MNSERLLTISTLIMDEITPDAQPYVMQVTGQVYDKGDNIYIFYDEKSEDPGYGIIKVRITMKPDSVEVKRESTSGARYVLEFSEKKECMAQYVTPYGSFPLQVKTREVVAQRGADGLTPKIALSYELFSDDRFVGDYFVKIEAAGSPAEE